MLTHHAIPSTRLFYQLTCRRDMSRDDWMRESTTYITNKEERNGSNDDMPEILERPHAYLNIKAKLVPGRIYIAVPFRHLGLLLCFLYVRTPKFSSKHLRPKHDVPGA